MGSKDGREIRRREFLKTSTAGAAGAGLLGSGALAACAPGSDTNAGQEAGGISGPEVRWRLASSFPRSLDILHGACEYVAGRVAALTGGAFQIRVFPAGEIVPGLRVLDAVQQGTVQAGFSADYYYIGKHPAFAFGTAVPFGLSPRQQISWLLSGGGIELMREVYADFGIRNFLCGLTATQMGGWFRHEVKSLADLRGLRMRIPGLGGEIMDRLGATVQLLAAGDIYPALERGAIDATEWVGPYDDEKLGFHEIAPYYYYPGWWEPGPTLTLQVGRAAWDELPGGYQEIIESTTREATVHTLARYDAEDPSALRRLVDEGGVQLRKYPDEILEAAWRASAAYLEEQAAAEAGFRKVYEGWKGFRSEIFRYFAGNEQAYATFAFGKVGR